MKLTVKVAALKKRKHTNAGESKPGRPSGGKSTLRRWAWAGLCLLVAAAGTLAVLEFVIWNKVPPALVGKWQIEEGPHYSGTFEFSRTGQMTVHLRNHKNDFHWKSRVGVDGKTIRSTTVNAQTREEETHESTILELTAHSMILELENGEVLKMAR
jgi:uncharacterized protein (TIGR03066 family)